MKPQQARRLVASLVLPDQVSQIASDSRLRHPNALQALLERIDGLVRTAPQTAVAAAEAAAKLVESVQCAESEKLGIVLPVQARVTLASACRAAGRLSEAETIYRGLLARAEAIPRLERALLLRRFAVTLTAQRRYEEALEIVDAALALHRELRSGEGQALVIRGNLNLARGAYGEAMNDLSAALLKLSPAAEWAHHSSCLISLAHCSVLSCPPAQIGEAIARVRRARRACRMPSWTVPSLKLRWIEGLLHSRLGSTRKAEASLTDARTGLLEVGCPQDVALVSLDLAGLLITEGRAQEARSLVGEAIRVAALGGVHLEALAALQVWSEGTDELVGKVLETARNALLASVAAHPER